jgi:hypothetical protein
MTQIVQKNKVERRFMLARIMRRTMNLRHVGLTIQ